MKFTKMLKIFILYVFKILFICFFNLIIFNNIYLVGTHYKVIHLSRYISYVIAFG